MVNPIISKVAKLGNFDSACFPFNKQSESCKSMDSVISLFLVYHLLNTSYYVLEHCHGYKHFLLIDKSPQAILCKVLLSEEIAMPLC